jgi:hypothetical protein
MNKISVTLEVDRYTIPHLTAFLDMCDENGWCDDYLESLMALEYGVQAVLDSDQHNDETKMKFGRIMLAIKAGME